LKQKGIELFRQRNWQDSANALEKSINTLHSNQQIFTYLGICYLRLAEYDRAIHFFEKIRPPIPSIAALNWAGLLTHKRKFAEALKVLSLVDYATKLKTDEEKMEAIVCHFFKNILSVISSSRITRSLESLINNRDRLIKLTTIGILPFLHVLNKIGHLAIQLGLPNGKKIRDLIDCFRGQCWVNGFPLQQDFFEGYYFLENIKGYANSNEVYSKIFLSYIDYWISNNEDIFDFILASQKPGDAHALYCMVREKQPSVILEIGTFLGFSSCLMAQAVKDNEKGTIICIDPNIKYFSVKTPLSHARRMLKTLKLDNHVQIHEGFFSNPRDNIETNIPVLGRNIFDILPPIDFAFIDADHATTAVLHDFMLLLPHISPNATIIFHDVNTWPTVRQGILTLFQDAVWKNQMRYFEFIPKGADGLGVVEVNRNIQK
jgi:predicted O-methyltransferase YrrM